MSYKLKTMVDDRSEAARADLDAMLNSAKFPIDGRLSRATEAILEIDPVKYAYTGKSDDRYWSAVKYCLIAEGYNDDQANAFIQACINLNDKFGDIVAEMIEEGFVPGMPVRVSNPPPEMREYMGDDHLYIFTAASFSYDPGEMWEQEEGVIEDFTADELILPAFVAPLFLTLFTLSLLGDSGGGKIFDTLVHHAKKVARKINRAMKKIRKWIKKVF